MNALTELLVGHARPAVDRTARTGAVVATVTAPDRATLASLGSLPATVTGLRVRADLTGDPDTAALRRRFPGMLIYSLRSRRHGGRDAGPDRVRRARLIAAAATHDIVELEAPHDLTSAVLDRIPPDQRCICWHGPPTDVAGLARRFTAMSRVPAWLYVLAPQAVSSTDALAPLHLLAQLGRPDVTGYGTGPAGTWSRILAPWLGAAVVFGHAGPADPAAADLPTVPQLLLDYGLPALPRVHALYGVAARSTNTSLFLRLLNAAHRELGTTGLVLPFAVPDVVSFRTRFWPGLADGLDRLGMRLCGLTVAAPGKEATLQLASRVSRVARTAGAANLLRRHLDQWRATTTDGMVVLSALRDAGVLSGRSVAVIGCGGAGRAAAAALDAAGVQVTLVNRGRERGEFAAGLLRLPFEPLAAFDPARYGVVVHATPASTELPFDVSRLRRDAVVVDFVCAAEDTALVAAARRRRLRTIDGRNILAREAARQFELMTDRLMPAGLAARVIG